MRTLSVFVAALLSLSSLSAQSPAKPVAAGKFDAALAPVIDRGLQRYVDRDRVPGIVALVMQDGDVVYEKAFGWADRESGRKMTPETVFRIASQTKALTSVAVMRMIEDGSLALSTRA